MVRRRVERRVERRLVGFLGPARHYEVRIRGTRDAELVRGRARSVEIKGSQIFANSAFLVDSLRLALFDLRYNGEEPFFVSVERSELEIEFTEAALNEYLKTYQSRYQPEVRFEPGRLRVQVTYRFLDLPTRINAVGRFRIVEGRQLLFDAEEADVSFLNTPGFGEKFVEDRVNPLLDLRSIDFPARLESVEVLQGRIRARGTASLPEAREARG
jgi:hypothetical protein